MIQFGNPGGQPVEFRRAMFASKISISPRPLDAAEFGSHATS
jgi:hypothetical protein